MKKYMAVFSCLLCLSFVAQSGVGPRGDQMGQREMHQFSSSWRVFWPNNIRTSVCNNGILFNDSAWQSPQEGMFWPGNTNRNVEYATGLWVSGRDETGRVRTALSRYISFYQPGRINGQFDDTNYTVADSPADPRFKILMISDTSTSSDPDYARWIADAAITGAPLDQNGLPLRLGKLNAYWRMNDLDTTFVRARLNHDPRPMGLEISNYVFAFDEGETLSNTIFLLMDIKNKSVHAYDSVYLGLFSDIDVGLASSNYPGCDTTLSLGYMYGGLDSDYAVYGRLQPACGFAVLESPTKASGRPMTAFMKDLSGQVPPMYILPDQPMSDAEYAYVLQGKLVTGAGICPPQDSSNIITYVNPGDPFTGTGWLGWDDFPPTDVRLLLSSGPCTLGPGDSVRFALACVVALDTGRLSSVKKLKEAVAEVAATYSAVTGVEDTKSATAAPTNYGLDPNYPNPFNPSTVVRYRVPVQGKVRITVYDVLGREVAVLVDEQKQPGTYTVKFDGVALASGMYVCRLQAGAYVASTKMLLVR